MLDRSDAVPSFSTRPVLRGLGALAALAAAVAAGACAAPASSDTPGADGGGVRPTPQPSRAVERNEPAQLTMNVAQPLLDRDGNGYPDALEVFIYLFPPDRQGRLPIWSDGTFEFRLRSEDGELLGAWDIPPEAQHAFRQRAAVGPGYFFGLELVEGEDVMPRTPANLFVTFVSDSGRRITGRGPASISVGAN